MASPTAALNQKCINMELSQINQFEAQNGDNAFLDQIKAKIEALNPNDPTTFTNLGSLCQEANDEEQIDQPNPYNPPQIDPNLLNSRA